MRKIVRKPPLELGVAVPVTPGSTPCPEGFVVQLPSQQDVVQQTERADRCAELFVGFGFKADALKAGAEMGDQVLNIVRIKAPVEAHREPNARPVLQLSGCTPTQTSHTPRCRRSHAHR